LVVPREFVVRDRQRSLPALYLVGVDGAVLQFVDQPLRVLESESHRERLSEQLSAQLDEHLVELPGRVPGRQHARFRLDAGPVVQEHASQRGYR